MTVLLVAMALTAGPVVDTIHTPTAKRSCRHECRARRTRRRWRRVVRPYNAKLNRMASCESTGRWHIATGNGYYGGLQFDLQTWQSVGGSGYPHHASELEQKYRAVRLIWQRGYQPWPICGYA